jgi:hypothetical protein
MAIQSLEHIAPKVYSSWLLGQTDRVGTGCSQVGGSVVVLKERFDDELGDMVCGLVEGFLGLGFRVW